jgi:hypothetical protein
MVSTLQSLGIALVASTIFVLINWSAKGAWMWFGENLWIRLTTKHVARVRGSWEAEYRDSLKSYKERMTIQQAGWKITGGFTCEDTTPNSPVKQLVQQFDLEGIIKNDVICAHYWGRDENTIGSGSLTLRLKNARTLEGGCVYYDPDSNEIVQDKYCWTRIMRAR